MKTLELRMSEKDKRGEFKEVEYELEIVKKKNQKLQRRQ